MRNYRIVEQHYIEVEGAGSWAVKNESPQSSVALDLPMLRRVNRINIYHHTSTAIPVSLYPCIPESLNPCVPVFLYPYILSHAFGNALSIETSGTWGAEAIIRVKPFGKS